MGAEQVNQQAISCELEVSSLSLDACGVDIGAERLAQEREAGRQAGLAEARSESAALVEAACEQLRQVRAETLATVSGDSVALAMEIAQQLIHVQLEGQRHGIEAMVRETLAQSQVGRGACVVHVSPADAELLSQVPFRAATRLEVDTDMRSGDVHVTTPDGTLVRELEPLLETLSQRLSKELR
ncbi:MAG: hypothetical protein CMK00_07405 [Planctomycetes bacterium]|jgi:flagellar biosynthesis/type III secretory pathway protein FliH|nr:hypothetical protein [Planctomycetota bacterium]